MQVKCIKHQKLADNVYQMRFEKDFKTDLRPGQFMMMDVNAEHCYLKRPFSFSKIAHDSFEIIYQVVGKGTQAMRAIKEGDECDLLFPLGQGFPINNVSKEDQILLIAGGLGFAPLLPIVDFLEEQAIVYDLVLGFENKNRAYGLERCTQARRREIYCMPETVLSSKLEAKDYDFVFTCGPEAMYDALEKDLSEHPQAYLSLEAPMACGLGLCSGCLKKGKKLCVEGPVSHVKEYYHETIRTED